jgi:hypothetical protein
MKLYEGEASTGAVGEDVTVTGLAARGFDFDDRVSRKSVPDRKLDEYEVDFSEIGDFAMIRWRDSVNEMKATIEQKLEVGGPSIAKTSEIFNERIRVLERDSNARVLDTLYAMTPSTLSNRAMSILKLLAFQSPGKI